MSFSSHVALDNLRFSLFSSEDVKKLSVAKIVTPLLFDVLGHALPGGLYDPAMGPYSSHRYNTDPCATCGNVSNCSGHSGHIELCTLVYNPVFIKTVYNILRMACLSCHKLQVSDEIVPILMMQLYLIDAGYDIEAQELEIFKHRNANSEDKENGIPLNAFDTKMMEFKELLEKEPINKFNIKTKNTESIRNAIVQTTVKEGATKKCIHCKEAAKKIKYSYKKLVITVSKAEMQSIYQDKNEASDKKITSSNKAILADECRQYLKFIYDHNNELLQLIFPILRYCSSNISCPIDVFFFDVIPVTPPTVRPANKLQDVIVEHPQTAIYKKIVESNTILRAIITVFNKTYSTNDQLESDEVYRQSKEVFDTAYGSTSYEKMYNAWQTLQTNVDQIWDMNLVRDANGQGVKQIIEKKEGIIRMHMMGKRVNYAARTVITPDPNINVDEIGIPDRFAKRLSYPVPVTLWNVSDLRKLVINGPDKHPGANFIQDEKGNTTIIPANDILKRESLSKTLLTPTTRGFKIVHRHLVNGDILLLNRQPSLHRPSIMGHKARILRDEKTFRLHYSNCKSYNADFDGDEMNAHFPQTELGRSEGYNLANVSSQYLVPKDGTPLGGLIQDHVIAGVGITLRGRFFNREDYHQMVYMALAHARSEIKTLPPTILKPHRLWSGKQIMSTIILNVIPADRPPINLKSTAKINARAWQNDVARVWKAGGIPFSDESMMSEAEIIIRSGELLVGVLDKTHYGATPYGLIHCMYELYGGACSTQLLTSFAKLFTYFLQREGFTLGVHDILLVEDADKKRRKTIKKCRTIGHSTTAAALNLPDTASLDELAQALEEAYIKDPKFRTVLDRQYKSALDGYTNKINKICLPAGLLCKFPQNNLQLMVGSGAKGSTVNTMQISCLLGQIELEGKRPPLMISGKSLPSFTFWETSPKSGGFIDGRFMTGIQPQEFFFHCMAGREGLIDTAVKTSRSGYLQRCLIKHFEGISVNYDLTVRDSDNSVIQFMYGEDGMDISKAQFLKPKQLSFLDDNAAAIVDDDLLKQLANQSEIDHDILHHKKKLRNWLKNNGNSIEKRRTSEFQQYSMDAKNDISVKNPNKRNQANGRRKLDNKIVKEWLNSDDAIKHKYVKKAAKCPDPIVVKYKPDSYFGSINEHLEDLMGQYLKMNPERKKEFARVICVKGMNSLAAPGEPVGLLAAQSIGEPSTQMTLNTFHFAGRGEMNVTLGIPRLREILMMASINIKTPSMDIPFQRHINVQAQAEKLRLRLARVTVADVLESIKVQSHITLNPQRATVCTLLFKFLPKESYADKFGVRPKRIITHMQEKFFKFMFKTLQKWSTMKNKMIEIDDDINKKVVDNDNNIDSEEPIEKPSKRNAVPNESSDDEDINEEDDATAAKIKSKVADTRDYDEPSDDEEKQDANSIGDDAEQDDLLLDDNNDNEMELDEKQEVENVLKQNAEMEEYRFDKKHFLWCQITFHLPIASKNLDFTTILREVANKSVIHEVPKIKRAITYNNNNDVFLKTDGINIFEMFQFNKILDLNRLYSNDIHAIARTYGIEAATRVITKEVKNVFNVYGITVDSRHLSLIADYMTFDGTFKPLSRRGMESSASPLQQMSFESSAYFLQNATISGRCDNLESPSSCLMVGKPCKTGTGSFTLLHNTDIAHLLK